MDAFFASVEQHDHPELRGKPIAVGYDGKRGVVATASCLHRSTTVRRAPLVRLALRSATRSFPTAPTACRSGFSWSLIGIKRKILIFAMTNQQM